ncbi:hypothetical protein LAG90_19255 [Marinilongibacter aquaticus]|uniref:hypothetical protein n=1 Tax=Marinilongibacter aquaticus TaxID=2975157 RepID=UPI0021BD614C|nr:hypothetical protein [Marinilongibacter aquaticus]UBM58939.1 hypothetical protein LAG90_19255 [Marinilongibacter aquaticus]
MRKSFLIILVALVIGFFTNPPLEKHQEAVKEEIQDLKHIDSELNEKSLKQIGAVLGDVFGLGTVDKYLEGNVKRLDLKVCSLTQVKVHDGYETIGIGLFGKVFIFESLKDKIIEKTKG